MLFISHQRLFLLSAEASGHKVLGGLNESPQAVLGFLKVNENFFTNQLTLNLLKSNGICMSKGKASIIIRTKNEDRWIKSFRKSFTQSYHSFEVILVDNDSKDNTGNHKKFCKVC